MALKLKRMDRECGVRYADVRYVWINAAQIETWDDRDGYSEITLASGERILADVSPDDLDSALGPDGNCPDGGPEACGYMDYVAAGAGGPSMPHAAYHVAKRAEVERLTADIEEVRRQLSIAEGVEDNLVTANERLEAENEELRAALQGFAAAYSAEFGDPLTYGGPVSDAARIAHDLLTEKVTTSLPSG